MQITELCVWVLAALVVGLVCALVWALWDRDLIAKDLNAARIMLWDRDVDLIATREALRQLRTRLGQSRKPALTCVVPVYQDAPADPEEFRRTQIRSVR